DAQFKAYQERAKSIALKIEGYKKDAANPQKQQAEIDSIQKEMVRLQRELEDINNEAKAVLNKKNDDESVLIYKEVQDMAGRFAAARGYDLVLTYNDAPANDPGVYHPSNVARKMQTAPM